MMRAYTPACDKCKNFITTDKSPKALKSRLKFPFGDFYIRNGYCRLGYCEKRGIIRRKRGR